MTRVSRSLAVLAFAATAALGGLAAAPAASADAGEPPSSNKCDVEYTVAYYTYKQLGYPDLEALLHAEKSYNLCRLTD
ncbi:hypothetical protein [Streptomyces sp. CBMA156]|uniref:hypothetical protein n=1 Tax=Streptomyces sp. CBMA156 TaxID=1930280 RepID=UPI001661D250|nr:hypothetical protein [Streptomyces sp. CBMA156]MBD0674024.1 hypothetical protein [Streptomyces sp. CBMA156]